MTTLQVPSGSAADVYGPMQAFIDSLPPKATLDFPCYGRYRCEKTVTFPKQMTVNANESLIYQTLVGDASRSVIDVTGPGVTISRLIAAGSKPIADGYNSALEGQHAFDLTHAIDAALLDCQGRDVRGDLLYVNDTHTAHIANFIGTRCGRAWCSVIDGTDITVDLPVLNDAGRSGFNFEPHNALNVTNGFKVSGGTFGWHPLNFVAMFGAEEAVVNAVTFQDGKHHTSGLSVACQGSLVKPTRTNLNFLRNVSDFPLGNPEKAAMKFIGSRWVNVLDNVQPMGVGRNMRMAEFIASSDYRVTGNTGDNLVGQILAA